GCIGKADAAGSAHRPLVTSSSVVKGATASVKLLHNSLSDPTEFTRVRQASLSRLRFESHMDQSGGRAVAISRKSHLSSEGEGESVDRGRPLGTVRYPGEQRLHVDRIESIEPLTELTRDRNRSLLSQDVADLVGSQRTQQPCHAPLAAPALELDGRSAEEA